MSKNNDCFKWIKLKSLKTSLIVISESTAFFYLIEVQTTLLTWVQRSCTMHVIFFILVPSAMFVLIDLKTNKNVDEPTIDGFP